MWPAVADCSRAETFSQLSSNKFTPLCTLICSMASTRKASESGEREGVERERAAHAVVSGEHGEWEKAHKAKVSV